MGQEELVVGTALARPRVLPVLELVGVAVRHHGRAAVQHVHDGPHDLWAFGQRDGFLFSVDDRPDVERVDREAERHALGLQRLGDGAQFCWIGHRADVLDPHQGRWGCSRAESALGTRSLQQVRQRQGGVVGGGRTEWHVRDVGQMLRRDRPRQQRLARHRGRGQDLYAFFVDVVVVVSGTPAPEGQGWCPDSAP